MTKIRQVFVMLALLGLMTVGISSAMAQSDASPAGDETPTPTLPATPPEQAATAVAQLNYPVAVHQGTCESPTAQPAYELDNAAPYGEGVDGAEVLGTSATSPVLSVNGSIDVSLDDVVNGTHVIAVHASPETFGTIVACGGIAGTLADGKLVVALQPVGDSTLSGIAILEEGDETNVTIYLTSQAEAGAFPTPAVTPTPVG
jgi:hypothetical protein